MTDAKNEKEEIRREDKKGDKDEEVAIALIAECHVGDKKFKAGETWTDPKHDCRMSICNPGGVISYLECPHFELEEGDEIRIPGDNKYAYPHCCDYVFRTKKKKPEDDEKGKEDQEKGDVEGESKARSVKSDQDNEDDDEGGDDNKPGVKGGEESEEEEENNSRSSTPT